MPDNLLNNANVLAFTIAIFSMNLHLWLYFSTSRQIISHICLIWAYSQCMRVPSDHYKKLKKKIRMKRACIAVFTNEYENNFSYLFDFSAQNILHASSIRPI